MTTEQSVRAFYAAFLGATDLEAFAREHFTDDIVWENFLPGIIPFGGFWRGLPAVVDYLARMMSVIRIKAFEIDRVVVEGDVAVVFGSEESDVIQSAGSDAVAPGSSYAMDWVHVLEFDAANRVVRAREYNDTAAMQAAFQRAG